MKTYKYKIGDQSNTIRLGNLLDDIWQVHDYFHRWQRQRYKDGLPYASFYDMCAHLVEVKRTTHPHWYALPHHAMNAELKRIDAAYQRFFKKLGGRPHIKPRHKFKSVTFPSTNNWEITDNRITITFRKWNEQTCKWQMDRVPFTFFKSREWQGNIRQMTIKRDACGDYWLYLITDYTDT